MPKPKKPSRLVPLKTLRIYCEGAKTEPAYLNAYLSERGKGGRQAVVEVEKTPKNTAIQLVEVAVAAKNSATSLVGDEFWVVYDRESPTKYPDALHAAALALAKKEKINVALTNVCFEYWLLLHFVNTTAPYGSFDDLWKTSAFKAKYKEAGGKDYEKSASSVFEVVKSGLSEARLRAKALNANAVKNASKGKAQEYQLNPYVGVVLLLDAIDAFK